MQGSKMFVPLGAQVPLEELIKGISIQSGNDGCVAVAEGIAGSEAAFAEQMNAVAKKLGMENSHFTDSSGWPHPENYTTPYDFYLLSAALIRDFPEYYHYFSDREFTYNNIRQFNRNRLLDHGGMKVDGLKTGHTQAAGYGIALSAMDPATKRRVILVINGLNSEDERAQEGEHLLLWGLRNFDNKTLYAPGQTVIRAKTHQATAREVGLTVKTPLIVTLPKPASELKASVTYRAPIAASTPSGTEVGTLTVTLPDGSTQSAPIVTAEALTSRGFFGKILGLFGL
jgi:D-alanyl-D-alanine carboxypeptidase (penicillin-binding protein 5/6)